MPPAPEPAAKEELLRLGEQASAHIHARQFVAAERLCVRMQSLEPTAPDAFVYRARIAQGRTDFAGAATLAQRALEQAPERLDVRLVQAECQIYAGCIAEALQSLGAIEKRIDKNFGLCTQLCLLYTQLGRHEATYRCAMRACKCAPVDQSVSHLLASAAMAVGRIDEAETLLDALVRRTPDDGDSYYNRAVLRTQTAKNNHIETIRQRLRFTAPQDQAHVPLNYALGKELEDIGRLDEAFATFSRGAAARKARLAYHVAGDVQTAVQIIQTFDKAWWEKSRPGDAASRPVFVLGLPRSGTTLVERILDSHSQITSLGEVNDLAYAVIRAGFPATGKSELIANAARADMGVLGCQYWSALQGYGEAGPLLIDKTPANYLYLGLIARALPGARIIHVQRHPLASGYAMFKTLFRMGYPFSYDLQDIGQFSLAHHRLMAHWRSLFGERMLDVQYEHLIDRQEVVSRAMIAHCGLEWESACLDFHRNAAPTATASAVQVRQPLYRTARDLWRHHEEALQPLRQILEQGGVACDPL